LRSRLIALLLLAAAVTVLPRSIALASPSDATAVSGGIGIRLVPVSDASHDALASSYVVDRLAPGTSITRSVEIVNDTRARADVSVYPAAASLNRGTFTFAPGRSGNELSTWTSVSRGAFRLTPDTKSLDTLTIKVPNDASPGERYAVVWAEVSLPPPTAGGVTLVNRVGIRMYLSIGPGGAPPSNFTVGSIAASRLATGEPLVVATVRNSGLSTLDISGTLVLSNGPGGLGAGPLAVTLDKVLAPGVSEPASVRLNKELPRGPWHAELALTSGLIHRSAIATITFPPIVGVEKIQKSPSFPTPAVLASIVLFVLLAIAVFALPVSRRRIVRMRSL